MHSPDDGFKMNENDMLTAPLYGGRVLQFFANTTKTSPVGSISLSIMVGGMNPPRKQGVLPPMEKIPH